MDYLRLNGRQQNNDIIVISVCLTNDERQKVRLMLCIFAHWVIANAKQALELRPAAHFSLLVIAVSSKYLS